MLLGDNTGGGAIVLLPIRFQCVGGGISTGYISYIHSIATCANFGLRRACVWKRQPNTQNLLMKNHVFSQCRVTMRAKAIQ
jgi:hypothetical protein